LLVLAGVTFIIGTSLLLAIRATRR
jgi:hypothetical protein